MDVAGKSVLLTGGSAGIGRELARHLKAKGAKVAITGRNKDRLKAMGDEGFEAIEANLSSDAGVDALVADLGDREIDILINNAGQGVDHDFREEQPDPAAADDCIYANLNAPIRLITALMPRLRRRPEATIVNVTSGLAISPRAGGPVYCATKAGLRSYSKAIRHQLKDTKVNVIEALPPVVDTQMTADRDMKKMPAEECAAVILDGILRNRTELYIGQTGLLRRVHAISPRLADRLVIGF